MNTVNFDSRASVAAFEGSPLSVLEWVYVQIRAYSTGHYTIPMMDEQIRLAKAASPKDNNLPNSFADALAIVDEFLVELQEYSACENDCLIFRGEAEHMKDCPKCKSKR